MVVGINFRQQPGRARIRREQFDDRHGVEARVLQRLAAIGQQLRTLLGGDESGHGELLKGDRAGLPRPCRATAQRSGQGAGTAAQAASARQCAKTLTARTAWHHWHDSKSALPLHSATSRLLRKRSAQASAIEARRGETTGHRA